MVDKKIFSFKLINNRLFSFFKNLFSIGLSQLVQVVVSFIKSKYLAVLGGSFVLGRLSLFNSGVTTLVAIIFLGFFTYSLKTLMTSASGGRREYINQLFVFTVVLITLSLLVLAIIPGSFFTDRFDNFWKVKFVAAVVIICGQLSLFFGNIVQSDGQYLKFARLTSFSSLFGLLSFLAVFYLINDIYYSIALSSFTGLVVYLFFSRALIKKLRLEFNLKSVLLVFNSTYVQGIVIGLSGFFDLVVLYILKLFIVQSDSISTLGYFDSILILFNSILGIFFSSVFTYFYPELLRFNSKILAYNKLFSVYAQQSLYILCLLVLFLFISKDLLLQFAFTKDFLAHSDFFKLLILVVPIRFANWYLNISVLIKLKPSAVVYFAFVVALFSLGIYTLGFVLFQLNGIALGMLIVNVISVGVSLFLLRKEKIKFPLKLLYAFLFLNLFTVTLYYFF